jgi:hypothetical protein
MMYLLIASPGSYRVSPQVNFKLWNDALVAKDYAKVASLYSLFDQGSIPSSSDKASSKHGQPTLDSFADFLKSLPIGTVIVDTVQSQSDDAYLHTGIFEFPGEQTVRGLLPVRARFAYMWRRYDSLWKITYHNSSALPVEGNNFQDCDAAVVNWEPGHMQVLEEHN